MRVRRCGRLRRGQSEVVGAAIALSLLILTGSVLFSVLSRSSRQTSLDLSVRYGFESERALEARSLEVRYRNDVCELVNAGNLRVVIVRLWFENGTYREEPVELDPGESDGGTLYRRGVVYAITSRGNIVPVKAVCEARRSAGAGPGAATGWLTSENYLGPQRLVGSNFTKRIVVYAQISGVDPRQVFVLYNYGSLWYYNDGVNGWILANSTNVDPDLDDNNINELVVVDKASANCDAIAIDGTCLRVYRTSVSSSLELFTTFVELLRILENPDVIVVYFKFLAEIRGAPALGVTANSWVTISSRERSVSSPASTSSASFSKTGGQSGVFVIVGSVTFPIRAYEVLREILVPGIYNLTISVRLDVLSQSQGQGKGAGVGAGGPVDILGLRLEYVAVAGSAVFNWLP